MFTQEHIEEPDNECGQSDTISVKEELRECQVGLSLETLLDPCWRFLEESPYGRKGLHQ